MKKEMKCPLCYKKVYSGLGKGCKLCGMSLEDNSTEFCSSVCKTKYTKINKSGMVRLSSLFLFTFLVLVNFVFAHVGEDEFGHHGMMNWGFGGFGIILWLLIITILILVIFLLVKQINKK